MVFEYVLSVTRQIPSGYIRRNGILSCALIVVLSFVLYLASIASICFLSLLVSFAMQYVVNLLVECILLFYGRVEIVCPVQPLFRAQEQDIYHVFRHFFQWLTVLFVQSQKKKRQHQEYHDECRRACADVWFCEKEKRYTDQRTAAEADKLPLR